MVYNIRCNGNSFPGASRVLNVPMKISEQYDNLSINDKFPHRQ